MKEGDEKVERKEVEAMKKRSVRAKN